jgi:hypothetical protein
MGAADLDDVLERVRLRLQPGVQLLQPRQQHVARTVMAVAICIAVGKVSFEDWPMLQWSLGCTGSFDPISPPSISMARLAITSLAFMFDWVPEPVCQTTSGKLSSSLPSITSCAASMIASPSFASSLPLALLASRRPLDDAERADDGDGLLFPADGEVHDRALGLRAPVLVGGHLEGAEAVGFGAGGGHDTRQVRSNSSRTGRATGGLGP